jgi:hypothetical protein
MGLMKYLLSTFDYPEIQPSKGSGRYIIHHPEGGFSVDLKQLLADIRSQQQFKDVKEIREHFESK